MPEKVGKPLERSEKEKAEDQKLLEEIAKESAADPNINDGDEEIFDPLAQQADRLPSSIKGSDGDKAHVMDVDDATAPSEAPVREEDEDFGGGVDDASSLTA